LWDLHDFITVVDEVVVVDTGVPYCSASVEMVLSLKRGFFCGPLGKCRFLERSCDSLWCR
jgi:hypothetical protein